MSELTRPYCCPEPRCTPIYNANLPDQPQPGVSWCCWGYLPEAIQFEYDGYRHKNDLSSCWCSALKGVIRWQENAEDWWATVIAYQRALDSLPLTVIVRLQKGTRDYILSRRTAETGETDEATSGPEVSE